MMYHRMIGVLAGISVGKHMIYKHWSCRRWHKGKPDDTIPWSLHYLDLLSRLDPLMLVIRDFSLAIVYSQNDLMKFTLINPGLL